MAIQNNKNKIKIMADTQEVMELSLEKVIESKLVQNNVTEQVLAALKDKYGNLRLASLDDKEGYLEIKQAAKEVAKVRTLTVSICKEGREEAVRTQKEWIKKEKEIVGKVAEVEDVLDAEIAKYDSEVKRKEQEEIKRKEEVYINRQAALTKMGATYTSGSFVLGEASFESELVKGMDDEIWNNDVLPKFQVEYEKIEAVKIAEQKKKDEEAAEFKRQQEELAEQKRKMEEQIAEMKRQQEDAIKKEQEAKNKIKEKRSVELRPYIVFIRDYNAMINMEEEEYEKLLAEIKMGAEQQWEADRKQAAEKVLADIETAKQQAIREEQERVAEQQRQAKIKQDQEELRKQQELEAANDKTKWDEVVKYLKNCPKFDMRSGQYRKKNQMYMEKIEEILSL